MNYILQTKKLSYSSLFQDINLNISKNSFIMITGANRCGKTVLLKILSGNILVRNKVFFNNRYLNQYSLKELYGVLSFVFPEEMTFTYTSVDEELYFSLSSISEDSLKTERYKIFVKLFRLNKYLEENPNYLDNFTKIKLSIARVLALKPQILFLDDICLQLSRKEKKEIFQILKYFQKEEGLTIVMTTSNLEDTIEGDFLYILEKGHIALEGKPLQIMEKDNILNKMGLRLPFMVDLSVKLRDYELVESLELDMDRMVDKLWK